MKAVLSDGQTGDRKMNPLSENVGRQTDPIHTDSDWSLLLKRMESAPFDHEGRNFVEKAGRNNAFYQGLEPEDALRCVRILQQHGLHDLSIEILEWLNKKHPDMEEAWREHLETLVLLGKRSDLLRLRARASEHVPTDRLSQWINENAGSRYDSVAESPDESADADLTSPFADLRRQEQGIRAYMNIFRGRYNAFARQWADKEQQRQGYVPVRRPMTMNDVREHLSGRKTYGIYLLEEDSTVHTGVIDIDLAGPFRAPEKMRRNRSAIQREAEYVLKRIADMASDAGLRFLAEASGGKGYHFWFPVSEPVDAGEMRLALQGMVDQVKHDITCFSLEVFPKQDRLSGKGLGNLVKLPLGIHRVTGKQSWLLGTGSRDTEVQLEFVRNFRPSAPESVTKLASCRGGVKVMVHPRHAAWAAEYPELAALEVKCPMLGQLFATIRSSRSLSIREEKVLLGTLPHLPRGRSLLHHLFSRLSEYNRPLLDYKISRVRGTPLGCKRIHSLLEQPNSELPCTFDLKPGGYAHPLLHLKEYTENDRAQAPISEQVANLEDAIENLRTAIRMVERFL